MKKVLVIYSWICTIYSIFIVLFFSRSNSEIDWWIELIIAAAPAIITGIALLIIDNQMNKLEQENKVLCERLNELTGHRNRDHEQER